MIRKNNLGTIRIEQKIFAQIVINAFVKAKTKSYLATPKLKLLGNYEKKINPNELSQNMLVEMDEDWLYVEFYLVTEFGTSIKETTDAIINDVYKSLQKMFPKLSVKVVIRVVGVKSKNIAPRDIEIVKSYESK